MTAGFLVAAVPLAAPASAAAASTYNYTSIVTYGRPAASTNGSALLSQLSGLPGGSTTLPPFTSSTTTSGLSGGGSYSIPQGQSGSLGLSDVLALLNGTLKAGQSGTTYTAPSSPSTGTGSAGTGSAGTGSTAGSGGASASTSCSAGAGTIQYVLCLTNAQRALVDAPPLTLDPSLDAIAQQRASALAADGTITHDIPGLGYASAMETAAGVTGTLIGAEDLSTGSSVDQAFSMLVTSPPHEANIQYAAYNKVGIAVAAMASGTLVLDLLFIEG